MAGVLADLGSQRGKTGAVPSREERAAQRNELIKFDSMNWEAQFDSQNDLKNPELWIEDTSTQGAQ